MGRKAKYKKEISKLLEDGFEAKQIIALTNIPPATVYRYVDKLKTSARMDFDQLMEKDYLYRYQLNLDNYARSIQQCNERLGNIDAKYAKLAKEVRDLMEELPEKNVMVKSNYMAQLIQLETQKNNEIIKLVAQRDRSTELKAKVYNAGPVVQAVDQWIRDNNPKMGDEPQLVLTNTKEVETPQISVEDQQVLEEME